MLLVRLPLPAADAPSAIIHSNGGVWVNGAEVADSTALFSGDTIETKSGFVANLDSNGSSVLIQGESVVKFQNEFLVLDHGSVAVGTSTAFSVHVNCIRVEPISRDRTQYDVTDLSGKVEVSAHKNDVNITYGMAHKLSSDRDSGQSATVHEGRASFTRRIRRLRGSAAAGRRRPHAEHQVVGNWRRGRRSHRPLPAAVQRLARQQHESKPTLTRQRLKFAMNPQCGVY